MRRMQSAVTVGLPYFSNTNQMERSRYDAWDASSSHRPPSSLPTQTLSSSSASSSSASSSNSYNQDNYCPLSLSTTLEAPAFRYGTVHKLWGMVNLDAVSSQHSSNPFLSQNSSQSRLEIDFVVVIDHSSSMRTNYKLAFVQATIEYLISQLDSHHRFCLIEFNHEVNVVTDGLVVMSTENKRAVVEKLRNVKAEGSTNISDALFRAIDILKNRWPSEHSRISTVMLFTDGLANVGLCGRKFTAALQAMTLPPGLTLNTFGYGIDHDSTMLQEISFSSKGGVYYFIETIDSIAATFGECLAGILSTVAHNISVSVVAEDGCRIVNIHTKFPVDEFKSVKHYGAMLGSMYKQESRCVLFKLSLRKMEKEISQQSLVKITVRFTNSATGKEHCLTTTCSISRPASAPFSPIPASLDRHINRWNAASAIEHAIQLCSTRDFDGARRHLTEAIAAVKKSSSASDPAYSQYCEDLTTDLSQTLLGMEDAEVFTYGIHVAHAFSTMYFMERSTGTCNLLGVGVDRDNHNEKISKQLGGLRLAAQLGENEYVSISNFGKHSSLYEAALSEASETSEVQSP
eukprot:TRINITY_DN5198_c0_g1_i5.p1 TRINITY_DN5198_c0_g1~~TRINITY_DN5198_c0_g1_i5.p1  ORF type:complete len:573 (+),score=118.31 TRINITY_DN5198_c0_g1_i5:213-1931(+)